MNRPMQTKRTDMHALNQASATHGKARIQKLSANILLCISLTAGATLSANSAPPLNESCQATLKAKLVKAYIDTWYYRTLSALDLRLADLYTTRENSLRSAQESSPPSGHQAARYQVLAHGESNMAAAARRTLEELGATPPDKSSPPPALQSYIPQNLDQARMKMRENGCSHNASAGMDENDTNLVLDSNWHQYQVLKAEIGDSFEPEYRDRTDSIMSLEARRQRLEKQHELLMHASEVLALTGQAERYAAILSGGEAGTTQITSELAESDAEAVMQALQQWIDDWSHRRISAYLAHYAPDFKPRRFHSRKAWARHRRRIISRSHNIHIDVGDPTLLQQGNAISVEFTQRYRSDSYRDTTSKRVTFKNIDGAWKIIAESNR